MKICDLIGHKYQSRYDYGAPTGVIRGAVDDPMLLIEASKPKTYVHDICVRCGNVIKKS